MRIRSAKGVAKARLPVRVKDLSMGGAHLVIRSEVPQDSVQEFTLDLGGEPFLATGRVLRSHPSPDGEGFDIGVQFIGLSPLDEERLRAYLARLPHWPR
jgi:hypothetical protein